MLHFEIQYTLQKTNMARKKSPFLIGDISSDGCFSSQSCWFSKVFPHPWQVEWNRWPLTRAFLKMTHVGINHCGQINPNYNISPTYVFWNKVISLSKSYLLGWGTRVRLRANLTRLLDYDFLIQTVWSHEIKSVQTLFCSYPRCNPPNFDTPIN